MHKYQVLLEDKDMTYECSDQQNLLEGMTRLGKKGIPVGCRGGGCGVCKIKILSGKYRLMKMSRAHVSVEEEQQGYVLACRCRPDSDIALKVIGQMKSKLI